MVYYTLRGGLGNMMFGIAATYAKSFEHNIEPLFTNIKTQLGYLDDETHFNPSLSHASEYMDLGFFKSMKSGEPPKTITVHTYPFHFEDKSITEDDFHLDGFFQSEKYFKKYTKEIKELFKPTDEIMGYLSERYSDLLNVKTTSIHVRRGDYLRHPHHHPTQTLDYYRKAIDLTKDTTDKYVIFSDDMEWCKQAFKGNRFIFIENEKDYMELYLMSLCDNNITSNSSFSWWWPWLNNNENKTVVGPKIWFGSAYNGWNTNDVLPEEWIKI